MIFGRFWKDRKASVTPLLAVAFIPMMGAIGASVDYSRGAAVRTEMQNAIDSTALMLSKDAQGLSAGDLSTKATTYFNAVFTRPEATNVAITPVFSTPQAGSFILKLTVTAKLSTVFWRVVGTPQLDLSATTEVIWGIKKLNLALALDNTGSMASSGKMTALKEAAHNLLNTLKAAEKVPGDILVSIVPFAVDVNVGTANVDASWIDWTDWDQQNGANQQTCTGSGWSQICTNTWIPAAHSTWNGCVKDRDQNYDTNDAAPTGSATKFKARQASACPKSMMPLTYDFTALHSKIDAMTPSGNTNVTIGLANAWQTLSTNMPYSAPAPAADLDKVIILLTDGQNTQNRWTSSQSSIDTRTALACANIKAANIRIYTVRVIDGNADLLRNCATNTTMYYDVDQASELNGVFSSIAQNLANLRIAK